MGKNRILSLVFILALVVLIAIGGWLIGSTIQSPAEVAARTAPPAPSPILVPVEERILSSDIVARGTVRFGLPQSISIAPSSLKPDPGLFTTLPSRNTLLKEGDVLLTASGRPLFVLRGDLPAYRDLVLGVSGEDVRQLEEALTRLGFDPGPIDGIYDERTGTAVGDWYTSAGWQPFGPTTEHLTNIRTLEQALATARFDKLAADDVVAAAPLRVAAARAQAAANGMVVAAAVAVANTPEELELAQATARAAQLAGETEIQASLDSQKVAEREAMLAGDSVALAAAALEDAQAAVGIQVPVDEIVFLPLMPVRVEQIHVVLGDEARGPAITVTNNQLAIDSSLPLDEGPLVRTGMAVFIDEPDLGIEATGVVERVADAPGTDGVDGFHIYFETLVEEATSALGGFSVRLTIPIESTQGMVIAIPISALSLAADGTSRVQVDNGGVLEFITVEPGLSADGFVEVIAVDDVLEPGQLVVIGYEYPG